MVRPRWGRRQRREIAAHDDLVMTGRCPACRREWVPRLGRAGPYFTCACPPRPSNGNG